MTNRRLDNPVPSSHQNIYEAIRKQVMAEHETALGQARGWRKDWIRWRINTIVEIRYRELLFLELRLNCIDHDALKSPYSASEPDNVHER